MSFSMGERVRRPQFNGARNPEVGIITDRYRSRASGIQPGVEQYEVEWDAGYRERGFLEVGLEREPLAIGGAMPMPTAPLK